ncbi:MAG: hypothetical protein QOH97_2428 [Actinoplanes sp.]|jgi:hypothetical protein|nr:hypothetical protein [Actinoplanes sp.]
MTVTAEDQFGAGHTSERPSWDCAACGQPWPCANAKGSLLQEFRGYPSVLAVYMSAQMCEAMLDLTAHGADPPADLYERFLSWCHHASAKPRSVNGFPRAGHLQRRRRRQAV